MRKYIFLAIAFLATAFVGCSGESASVSVDSTITDTVADLTSANNPASRRIRIKHVGSYREVFNDSNKFHYAYAEKLGIDPITDIKSAYNTRRPLVKIESNEFYHVDSLTHSLPYLVPEAARLLEEIGRNFIDTLNRRGGEAHKIKVTSLLRTSSTVKRLRRINVNASDSSTHQFATTFDISWSKFHCNDSTKAISSDILKGLLAEVLADLRKEGKCLIKHERKTPCFHITVTK